jgi:hypothetical protein
MTPQSIRIERASSALHRWRPDAPHALSRSRFLDGSRQRDGFVAKHSFRRATTIAGMPSCALWPSGQHGAVITCAPWPSCGPGSSAPLAVDAGNNGFIVVGGDF